MHINNDHPRHISEFFIVSTSLILILFHEAAFAENQSIKSPVISICGQKIGVIQKKVSIHGNRRCSNVDYKNFSKLTFPESIETTDVDDTFFKSLRGHKTIRKLSIIHSKITNRSLAHISTLPNLTHLSFYECKGLTGVGLSHLSKLRNLQYLMLSENQTTDVGMVHLAKAISNISNIKMVHIEYRNSDFQGCLGDEPLCIDLRGGLVSNAGIKALLSLPITDILLEPSQIDDSTIALLYRIKGLKRLNCTAHRVMPSLKKAQSCINLEGVTKVTERSLSILSKMEIAHLMVEPALLKGKGLSWISMIKGIRSLNSVYYGYYFPEPCDREDCPFISDQTFSLEKTSPIGLDILPLRHIKSLRTLILPKGFVLDRNAAKVLRWNKSLNRVGRWQINLGARHPLAKYSGIAFDLSNLDVQNDSLNMIIQKPNLQALALPERDVNIDTLRVLRKAKGLKYLILKDGRIQPEAVKELVSLKKLEHLSVPADALSQDMIDSILSNPVFRSLNFGPEECYNLCNTPLLCENCFSICNQHCLLEHERIILNLKGSVFEKRKIAGLEKAGRPIRLLQKIFNDKTLEWLARNKRVESFNCVLPHCMDLRGVSEGRRLTFSGLHHLAHREDIERLFIESAIVDDQLVRMLGQLVNLRAFNMEAVEEDGFVVKSPNSISVNAIRQLRRIKNLKRLTLNRQDVTNSVLRELVKFPSLEALNCWFYRDEWANREVCINLNRSRVTRKGVIQLSKFSKIGRYIVPPKLLDDRNFPAVVGTPQFLSLNCPRHQFGHQGLDEYGIALVDSCVGLHSGHHVTDKGLKSLRGKVKTLLIEIPIAWLDQWDQFESMWKRQKLNYKNILPKTHAIHTENPYFQLPGHSLDEL